MFYAWLLCSHILGNGNLSVLVQEQGQGWRKRCLRGSLPRSHHMVARAKGGGATASSCLRGLPWAEEEELSSLLCCLCPFGDASDVIRMVAKTPQEEEKGPAFSQREREREREKEGDGVGRVYGHGCYSIRGALGFGPPPYYYSLGLQQTF